MTIQQFFRSRCIRFALWLIAASMRNDRSKQIMWGWQCNFAMMAMDAGAPKLEANERAADFMGQLLNVNVRELIEYRELMQDLTHDRLKEQEKERVDKREIQEFGTPIY